MQPTEPWGRPHSEPTEPNKQGRRGRGAGLLVMTPSRVECPPPTTRYGIWERARNAGDGFGIEPDLFRLNPRKRTGFLTVEKGVPDVAACDV